MKLLLFNFFSFDDASYLQIIQQLDQQNEFSIKTEMSILQYIVQLHIAVQNNMIIGNYNDITGNNAIKLGEIWDSAGRQYHFWECKYDFLKSNHQSSREA